MTIYFREYGDKSATLMVFLHGGGVSGWMWDRQIQFFKGYHCIVPDLPCHGQSHQHADFSIKGTAETIVQLIKEKANGKKVVVIGFSLGSQVLIQMLALNPELIDFSIINSALIRPITYGQKLIKPTLKMTFPLIKNRWFSKLQAKTLYIGDDYFEKYYEESCQMKVETLVAVMKENMSFEIPPHFKRVKGKILVTVGEKEKTMMKKSAKDIVDANPNCLGVVIPKIGHGAPIVIPDDFNNMVQTWLETDKLPAEYQTL